MTSRKSEEEVLGMYIYSFIKGLFDILKTMYHGAKRLSEKKSNLYYLVMYLALGLGLFFYRQEIIALIPSTDRKFYLLGYSIYAAPALPFLYLYYKGEDHKRFIQAFDDKFEEIGFFTRGKKRDFNGNMIEKKMYPKYMGEVKDGDIVTYSFYSNIPLEDWRLKSKHLEMMLDCNILKIENASSTKKVIKLKTVPA